MAQASTGECCNLGPSSISTVTMTSAWHAKATAGARPKSVISRQKPVMISLATMRIINTVDIPFGILHGQRQGLVYTNNAAR